MTEKKLLNIDNLPPISKEGSTDINQDITNLKERIERVENSINTPDFSNWENIFNKYEDLIPCTIEEIINICLEYTTHRPIWLSYMWGAFPIGPLIIYYVRGYPTRNISDIEDFVIGFRIMDTAYAFKTKNALVPLEELKKKQETRNKKKKEEIIEDPATSPVKRKSWWRYGKDD